MSEYVALFLIWVGVIIRMVVPAMRKYLENGEEFKWSHRYTVTAALSLIVSAAASLVGFTMFSVPDPFVGVNAYIGAIVFGFGLEDVIVEVMEWAWKKEEG
jgi:hypothetical protein